MDAAAEWHQHAIGVHDQANSVMAQLDDLTLLLEDKEMKLRRKEELLVFEQDKNEDLEGTEEAMIDYINAMATMLDIAGVPLPIGLKDEFYYGRASHAFGLDDEGAVELEEDQQKNGGGKERETDDASAEVAVIGVPTRRRL
jgi:hypothetical protein